MYKLKIGRSVVLRDDFYKELAQTEQAGIDAFDLDLTVHCFDRKNEIELYKSLPAALERVKQSPLYFNGVHISFGPAWDYSDLNEENRKSAVALTKEMFELINPYNPHCYIMHGSIEPVADLDRVAKIEQLKKSMKELRAYTNALLCVETLPRTCLLNTSAETLDFYNDCENIDICLDCNHFLQETPQNAVSVLGKAIKTTHISDYDFIDERHVLPKKGKIDWNAFIGALEQIGYDGIFNYEVSTANYASAAEVKQNAEELFAAYNESKKKNL